MSPADTSLMSPADTVFPRIVNRVRLVTLLD